MTEQSRRERPGVDALPPSKTTTENFDATRDPRTGRPPNPLEAERLAREHEERRAESQNEEGSDSDDGTPAIEEFDSEAEGASEFRPSARMASPKAGDDERAAVDALVEEGITRERAEELVTAHGVNLETLKAAAFAGDAQE